MILRYVDDIVVGFQDEADARRFWEAMRLRFEQFSLALHPDKTPCRSPDAPSGYPNR